MPGYRTPLRYSAGMGNEVMGPILTTPEFPRLRGLTIFRLNRWACPGLVVRAIRGGSARRRAQLRSVAEQIQAVKKLREASATWRVLTQAPHTLSDNWAAPLRGRSLHEYGDDLNQIGAWSDLLALLQNPGQTLLRSWRSHSASSARIWDTGYDYSVDGGHHVLRITTTTAMRRTA